MIIDFYAQLEARFPNTATKSKNILQKEISPQERETLLKLVATMAVKGYRFDPNSKRNDATADIRNDLELIGFSMDDKTILKWLRVAADLVGNDYWDN